MADGNDQPKRRADQRQELDNVSDDIRVTRRLVTSSLVAAALLPASATSQTRASRETIVARPLQPKLKRIRRAEDMLVLDYRLHNLRETYSNGALVLERINNGKLSWIAVEHAPQHVFEFAYWDASDPGTEGTQDAKEPVPRPPQAVPSRLAGRSRLVFAMPAGINSVPWGLDALLEACRTWPMRLDPLAKPAPASVAQLLTSQEAVQAQLDLASQKLVLSLPAEKREVVAKDIARMSDRAARDLSSKLKRSGDLSDDDVDRAVAGEVDQLVERSGVRLTAQERARTERAVEAQSTIRLIPEATASGSTSSRRGLSQQGQLAEGLVPEGTINFTPLLYSITPHAPAPSVTAIELPYRVIQTPLATAGWNHADGPVTHRGRTELWHTRMGRRTSQGVVDFAPQKMRAMWSPDYEEPKTVFGQKPTMPVYGDQRQTLVRLTAGFNEKRQGGRPLVPKPVTSDRLILSALGATYDMKGAWSRLDRPIARTGFDAVDMESWAHRTATGRDYYVRIVTAGFLYPFGHQASLIVVTERKFETGSDGKRIAVLRQRGYLQVREKSKEYKAALYKHKGREFPFSAVEILTDRTPPLAQPGQAACESLFSPLSADAFVPLLGNGEDFRFDLMGTDQSGRRVPFSMPLIFIRAKSIGDVDVDDANAKMDSNDCQGDGPPRGEAPMGGAIIQFAPQVLLTDTENVADGDTNIPAQSITFHGVARNGIEPPFLPVMASARLKIPAVEKVLGSERPVNVAFSKIYLDHGFKSGGGVRNDLSQVFLDIINPDASPLGVSDSEPSQSFGGLVNPSLIPQSLSRKFGAGSFGSAVDAANSFLNGEFDPTEFIPDAKLLGVFSLKDILETIALAAPGFTVPKLKTIELPESIEARYEIAQSPLKDLAPLFYGKPNPKSSLSIVTSAVVRRDPTADGPLPQPAAPEVTVTGELKNFQLNLFTVIIVDFDEISFVSKPGEKAKVDVVLNPDTGLQFGGPLEFINRLRDFIPFDGFGDPSPIDLAPTGLTVGYALTLPQVNVGVTSLQNISLGARASLSFTGAPPSIRFNFAERHSPFNITVSLLGGGGFAAATLDTEGMKEIEVSFEFGARLEMDFVVASGGVYVKVGIYFALRAGDPGSEIELTAFFELGGHVSVMGIASVSITFHLALTYKKGNAKAELYGEGYLLIEVSVLFFSASFDIRMQRKFAGSDADPTFVQLIPQQSVWDEYCGAFA
ncbi:MAG: hypothetical protein HRU11_02565 [Parvularculaceae bacterium]|nr:hypothetical protein [Parvularculaceae bacterium]